MDSRWTESSGCAAIVTGRPCSSNHFKGNLSWVIWRPGLMRLIRLMQKCTTTHRPSSNRCSALMTVSSRTFSDSGPTNSWWLLSGCWKASSQPWPMTTRIQRYSGTFWPWRARTIAASGGGTGSRTMLTRVSSVSLRASTTLSSSSPANTPSTS